MRRSSHEIWWRERSNFIESKGGVYSLKDIVAEFGNPASGIAEDYLEVLRELIDDGVVPVYES